MRTMAFCFVGLVYGWASTLDGPRSFENLSTALRNTLVRLCRNTHTHITHTRHTHDTQPLTSHYRQPGVAVKCAAKLASVAQGGQVLVTDSLRRDLDATATDRALIKRLQPSGTLNLLQSTGNLTRSSFKGGTDSPFSDGSM